MEFLNANILPILVILPLVAALITGILKNKTQIRWISLIISLVIFIISLHLYFNWSDGANWRFDFSRSWIEMFNTKFHFGLDGISLLMVLLTTFLLPISILVSWTVEKSVGGYFSAIFVLTAGMIGVFAAADLFLFYIFWEMMLIPMFFLIGIWGGKDRIYATVKFVLYTMVGSLLMLVAIFYIYSQTRTMDIAEIMNHSFADSAQIWLFLAFGLSFAIKVPLFPFHTWLPDAHVQAPTAGSVILAGVLLKMGGYGFLRFCLPMFEYATEIFMPWIAVLALIGIIYGALVAMVQPDMKKLVAYSSVSHLGFVMLGIATLSQIGMSGGVLQMVNHGLATGALFALVGMIYERRHTRMIADFGGIAKSMPAFATVFMIVTLASIGLPGLNGFVGEFMIILAAFQTKMIWGILAASGVILAAVYMLWMVQRVFFGKVEGENAKLSDMNLREWLIILPLIAGIVWIGVHPQPLLDKINPDVQKIVEMQQSKNNNFTEFTIE
ncbi:NADH-quinone oxidoreductase subunit M [bacterium]|nr:NADH-quinone oxidoreductase subunit M [bacterium]